MPNVTTETLKRKSMKSNGESDLDVTSGFLTRRGVLNDAGELRLKELFNFEMAVAEIPEQLGTTEGTIRRYAKKFDIDLPRERRTRRDEDEESLKAADEELSEVDEDDEDDVAEPDPDDKDEEPLAAKTDEPRQKRKYTRRVKSKVKQDASLTDSDLRNLGELVVRASTAEVSIEEYVESLRNLVDAWDKSKA